MKSLVGKRGNGTLARVLLVMPFGMLFVCAGCSTPPTLDDAQLVMVRLATPQDRAHDAAAEDTRRRELFGGATVNDSQRGKIVFAASDYDAYLAYEKQRASLFSDRPEQSIEWPKLRVVFRTARSLTQSNDVYFSRAYFCGEGPEKISLISGDLMWRNHFVSRRAVASEIEATLAASAEPQEYEVSVGYTHWAEVWAPRPLSTVTLLPPPDDICVALEKMNWPLAPTYGKPLRIKRETFAVLLDPLPRRLPHSCQDGQMRLEC